MKYFLLILTALMAVTTFGQTDNMNFEEGNFDGWILDVGIRTSPTEEDYNSPFPIDINDHIRLMNPGVPPLDEYGILCSTPDIPTVFPGGLISARLGDNPGGRVASRISRTFVVDPDQTYLQYSYSIILEEPGHSEEEQPKFVVNIKDSNGEVVTCGKFEAFAGPNAEDQGFVGCDLDRQYRCDFPIRDCPDSPNVPNGWPIQILPWTSGGADLTPFIGQQITVEFLALDCMLGAHGATAYVEANIEPLVIQVTGLCASGDDIILSAPIGFVSYLWSTGETTREISVPNAQFGDTYTVQLVSNTGCDTSTSITLEPKPDASIDVIEDQVICRGANAIITPTGIDAFNFYFPDIDFTGLSVVLNPDTTTTYTVIALNENGCEGASTTFTIEVLEGDGPTFPEAAFEMNPILDTTLNTCNTVQFTNLSEYCRDDLEYEWDFGDGSPISTEENPIHTFPVTPTQETYTITLTVTSMSDGQSDTTSQTFDSGGVSPSFELASDCAVVTITNTTMICDTSFSGFTNFTYSWDFGDGTPPVVTDETQTSFDHTFLSSDSFTIVLTMEDLNTGTIYTERNTIEVVAGLQSDFEYITDNCYTVFFRDLSTFCDPIASYEWNFGDGSVLSTEVSPTHTYTSIGPHTVTLTIEDGTDTSIYTEDITLAPIPTTPGFTYEQVCQDLLFTNTTTSCVENLTYYWNYGDGSPLDTEMNTIHTFEYGNTYTVTLTVNDGVQDHIFSQTIQVDKEFVFVTPEDMQICAAPGNQQGEFNLASQTAIILQNVPPGTLDFPIVSYHLTELDAENDINNVNTDFTITESSQVIYARVEESDNCFEILSFSLQLDETPELNTIEDIFLCTTQGNSRIYDLQQLNARLLDGLTQVGANLTYHETLPDAEANQNSILNINLIAGVDVTIYARVENIEQGTCYSISQFNLRLDNQETGLGDRCFLTFSNAMTPNGDGANDTFVIDNIDAYPNNRITIYNRWGNQVYQVSGYNNTWNGTYNGKPLPVATYYYILELNDESKQKHSGYISILR